MKDIIRFKRKGAKLLIFSKVTNEQAQEWCSHEHTRKAGEWFDGFAPHGQYCTKQKPKYAKFFSPNDLK